MAGQIIGGTEHGRPRFVWPARRWALVWLRAIMIGPAPLAVFALVTVLLDFGRGHVLGGGVTEVARFVGAIYLIGVAAGAVLAALWLIPVLLIARWQGHVGLLPGTLAGGLLAGFPMGLLLIALSSDGTGPGMESGRFMGTWSVTVACGAVGAFVALWLERRRERPGWRPEDFD